jgi:excisionase family DNA binding protein
MQPHTAAEPADLLATPFLRIGEAAEIAHVSRTHIKSLIERGEIEAVHVGPPEGRRTPVRILTQSFLAYLYGDPLPEERPPVTEADLRPWLVGVEVDLEAPDAA